MRFRLQLTSKRKLSEYVMLTKITPVVIFFEPDYNRVWFTGQFVNFFQGNLINFVVCLEDEDGVKWAGLKTYIKLYLHRDT